MKRRWVRAAMLCAGLAGAACGEPRAEAVAARAEPPATAEKLPLGPVFADTVTLAPGAVRAWDLAPANYDIAVRSQSTGGAPSPLELVADITCTTDSRDTALIHCYVGKPTRFVLRHSAAQANAGRASAFVSITRVW